MPAANNDEILMKTVERALSGEGAHADSRSVFEALDWKAAGARPAGAPHRPLPGMGPAAEMARGLPLDGFPVHAPGNGPCRYPRQAGVQPCGGPRRGIRARLRLQQKKFRRIWNTGVAAQRQFMLAEIFVEILV